MKVKVEYDVCGTRFECLKAGDCFVYAHPYTEDQVYMRVTNSWSAVSLKTGVIYDVQPNKSVILVEAEVTVRKSV